MIIFEGHSKTPYYLCGILEFFVLIGASVCTIACCQTCSTVETNHHRNYGYGSSGYHDNDCFWCCYGLDVNCRNCCECCDGGNCHTGSSSNDDNAGAVMLVIVVVVVVIFAIIGIVVGIIALTMVRVVVVFRAIERFD